MTPTSKLVKPQISLRAALEDPELLGTALQGHSWHAWQVLLLAAVGEPLRADELATFKSGSLAGKRPPQRVVTNYGALSAGGVAKAMQWLSSPSI
jgi:hypothetical protein